MNNKTRIFSKGIQHFQQGGNIAIGSPKPYTNNLPAVNINPLTLANHPIEINTTGITDQINKMRDLAFKREELAFKYKELDYKEGAQYLDLLGDIYKGIGSANSSAASSGGFGSLGVYGQKQAEINAKRNEIMGKLNTASSSGRTKDVFGIINELAAFETSPDVLTHKTKATFINDAVKSIQKGDLGIYGPEVFDQILGHVMKGDGTIPFEDLAKNYTTKLGGSVAAKDLGSYLGTFDPLFVPQEVITSTLQKNGLIQDKKSYLQKSPDEIYNVINSSLSLDPNGKALKHQLEITAANTGTTTKDLLMTNILARLKANEKSVSKVFKGNLEKDAEVVNGMLKSDPDTKADKMSEGDKDREFTMKYITDRYGHNQKEAINLAGVLKGDALIKKLEELEAAGKITPIGGGEGKGGGVGKQATEEDFRKSITIREDDPTMFFTGKDGDRYVATVDEKVAKIGKQFKFPSEVTSYDKVVREKMTPEDAKKWNVNPWEGAGWFEGDITIFKVSSKGDTSANSPQDFDMSTLGEQKPATVKELGLPTQGDPKGKINSHLGEMARDILVKNNLVVTDTSDWKGADGKGHRSKAQQEYGTAFDVDGVNLKPTDIKRILAEFRTNGLDVQYEVKTEEDKKKLIAAAKEEGVTFEPSDVKVVDRITGSHFSVYCDTCTRIQALQGGSNQTPQTKIQNTSGIVGKTAEELIGM